MVRHCTCGLYFTRRWLVKYKSPLVQYLTILHSTPCNNIYVIPLDHFASQPFIMVLHLEVPSVT